MSNSSATLWHVTDPRAPSNQDSPELHKSKLQIQNMHFNCAVQHRGAALQIGGSFTVSTNYTVVAPKLQQPPKW